MRMGHWGRVAVHRLAFRHLLGLDIMNITALFGTATHSFRRLIRSHRVAHSPASVAVQPTPFTNYLRSRPPPAPARRSSQATHPHGFSQPPGTLTNPRSLQRFLLIAKPYGDNRKLVLENTIALVHIGPMMLPSRRSPAASTHTARHTPRLRFAA